MFLRLHQVALFAVVWPIFAAPCTAPTGIAAAFRNGQTFVTWSDVATGSGGADYRYRLYRSTSGQITTISGLQPWAQVLNNSGQFTPQQKTSMTQTWKQDNTKRMAIAVAGGSQLAFGTGLAVWTATASESAWYAVTSYSVTAACEESAVNATTSSVSESVATPLPVRQIQDQDPTNTGLTGTQRPLWVQLHASGGGWPSRGDTYAYWGNSTMGWYPGIMQAFSLWEDRGQGTFAPISVVVSPQDAIFTLNGTTPFNLETYWFGYNATPLNGSTARIYPYTERWLDAVVSWVRGGGANVDLTRVYSWGRSMGAWGSASWAIKRPSIFAAHFLHMPRFRSTNTAGTWQVPSLPDSQAITATSLLMDDGTPFTTRNDQVAYVSTCTTQVRPILWGIGSIDEYSRWQDHLDMRTAMNDCRRWYAFKWSNTNHATDQSLTQLLTEYQQVFRTNVSYPAFHSSSLDNNPASDANGCINCGWTWTVTTDNRRTWAASVANSNNSAGVTVSVTPQNTQAWDVGPNEVVDWACPACTVTSGTATATSWGAATAAISIPASTTATITFTRRYSTNTRSGGLSIQ